MGDKKKKGGKKKGGGEQEEDQTPNILPRYKKKCEINDVQQNKLFREKVDFAVGEGEQIELVYFLICHLHSQFGEIGPVGIRAIFDTLTDLTYKPLKSIKLWKIQAADEGTRCICNFMLKTKKVEVLDLLDNDITPLGCEFLGKALIMNQELPLLKLKLDHNEIGTEGLAKLAEGLALNNNLEKLSLNYCSIDASGAIYLQQILGFVDTKIWSLKLQGNLLKNEGIFELFRAMEVNQSIEKLNISDNQFGESTTCPVIRKICEVMDKNKVCGFYNFRYNGIYEEGAKQILESVRLAKHIYCVILAQHLSKELTQEFKTVMKKRKPKKKKKKGKKGRKGKKKR